MELFTRTRMWYVKQQHQTIYDKRIRIIRGTIPRRRDAVGVLLRVRVVALVSFTYRVSFIITPFRNAASFFGGSLSSLFSHSRMSA